MEFVLIGAGVVGVAIVFVAPIGIACWCIAVSRSQAAVLDCFDEFDRKMQ